MSTPVLQAAALSIGYPRPREVPRTVASGISLGLAKGEFVCLLGPNGAGKSTFLRTISGLQRPLAGRVLLDGRDIHAMSAMDRARAMSVVLTERVTAGLFTGYDLVSLGRQPHTDWRGTLTPNDHAIVDRALHSVSASELADRAVAEMSDGERQRIMVARALAQEPRVMVLDEITAFLDLPRRVDAMRLLSGLAHSSGMAVLVSTHDLDLALRTADTLWLVSGDGGIQCGAPEDLVLDGSLERTFSSEGLIFDAHDGSFRMRAQTNGSVVIAGSGPAAHWTQRAIERAGYKVATDQDDARFQVEVLDADGHSWRLTGPHGTVVLHSVNALVEALRR